MNFHNHENNLFIIHISGKQVPALKHAQINVRFYRRKPKGVETLLTSTLTVEPKPKAQEYSEKVHSTIHIEGSE